MAMITDHSNHPGGTVTEPGRRVALHEVLLFVGGVLLLLVAAGMWIAPRAYWGEDLFATKLLLSMILSFVGIAMVQAGLILPRREVEIDTDKGEVRVVRHARGKKHILNACAFEHLAAAQSDNVVRLWDGFGNYMADIPLNEPSTRGRLIMALKAAGKID